MADSNLPNLGELAETPASGDELYIVDKSDTTDGASGTNKKVTRGNLVGGLASTSHTHTESDVTDLDHTDADAIHDNVSGEINALTEKVTPVSADLLIIEDSAASNGKKKLQIGNIPSSGDVTGPGSATDNAISRFDGTGGKVIQNSGVTIDDSDNLSGVNNADVGGYVDVAEIAAPADPSANTLRLYAQDEGGFSVLHKDDENGVKTEIGRDTIHVVRNTTGATLTKGQVVYISGSNGTYPTVALADASDSTKMPAFGLVVADIANNSFGQVIQEGDLGGLDTSSFSDGQVVFVSASTAGALTATEPTGTDIDQRVGVVIKGGTAGAGIIEVDTGGEVDPSLTQTLTNKTIDANNNTVSNIALGAEATGALTDLSDVDTDKSKTPADGDVLTFDGTDWNAEAAAGGGGGQTLYDVVLDASGGGDYTDWSTAMAALTAGQTMFVRSGTYSESSPIAFSTNDVTIIGENPESTILYLTSSSNSGWSAEDLTIKNIMIRNGGSGRWQFTGSRLKIIGCNIGMIGSASSFAMQFSGSDTIVSNNYIFDTTSADDRKINVSGQRTRFTNNICEVSNGSNSTTIGWLNFQSSDGICDGNIIDIGTTSTTGAPAISGNGNALISNNVIEAGGVSTALGIYMPNSCIAIGNDIQNAYKGIRVGSDCVCSNNRAITSVSTSSVAYEVAGSRSVVSNNWAQGNTSATAIELGTGSDSNSITGNVLYNWSVGVSVPASTADKNVIMGNTFPSVTTDISDSGTGTLYQTATDSDALNTN